MDSCYDGLIVLHTTVLVMTMRTTDSRFRDSPEPSVWPLFVVPLKEMVLMALIL